MAMSSSLADELMNDLGSSGDEQDDELDRLIEERRRPGGTVKQEDEGDDDGADEDMKEIKLEGEEGEVRVPEGGVKPTLELDPEEVNGMQLAAVAQVNQVAKLYTSKSLKDVLENIEYYKVNPDPRLASDNDSLEYQLIVKANNLSVDIDNELLIVHKFIRDHYYPRFPELDSLVSSPLPFCRVILALGNNPELRSTSTATDISGILTSGAVMAVHVTAATSKGVQLSEKEWDVVVKACEMMFGLEDAKKKILEYVESRISLLAPNISAIVGTTTATKILGIAGGLQGLSRIPHSNIYVLGAVKRASTGFSTASHSVDRLHTGFIYQCPLVQQTRPEDRMKAQRKIGTKVALAVRVDMAGSSPDASFGYDMVDKLEREFERLGRPPPGKTVKALPKPEEKKKSHRGGQRARKAKEGYAMTELRKLQNRVKFGEAEEEVGAFDTTRGMGMIGSASGSVRAQVGEARSKAKMSKSNKNRLSALKASSTSSSSGGSATSGLASSLAFTPVQGLELLDPAKQRALAQVKAANESWFADGTFTHVRKEKGLPGAPQR